MAAQWKKSTCPYCGVGCGLMVKAEKDRIVDVLGMKDHPVNDGDICALPANYPPLFTAEGRLTQPMIRGNGTPRLLTDLQFPRPDGRAALLARDYKEPAETTCNEYPFVLITGRLACHFNTRTRTGRGRKSYISIKNRFYDGTVYKKQSGNHAADD